MRLQPSVGSSALHVQLQRTEGGQHRARRWPAALSFRTDSCPSKAKTEGLSRQGPACGLATSPVPWDRRTHLPLP